MNKYTKIIGIAGTMYTKEFVKIKHHQNKTRFLTEATVIKAFKNGNSEVDVYFEETDKILTLTPFSDEDDIRKYLGKKFLSY